MPSLPRSAGASACPEAPRLTSRVRCEPLVPLVRLLARQAVREYLLAHPATNDNQPGPETPAEGEPT